MLNKYWLNRWSGLVRARDGYRCMVCGKVCKKTTQAHHVYAKNEHPDKAYDLSNGATVCEDHHQPLVHVHAGSWAIWTDFFKRQLSWKKNSEYNKQNQIKIKRVR